MDAELLRLKAHIDQSRSEMRQMTIELGTETLVQLVKTCAAARLSDLDEPAQRLVGALAIVAIFDLIETRDDAGE